MADNKKRYIRNSRQSTGRRVLSYMILGMVTVMPLVLYYVPSAQEFLSIKISIFDFSLGGITVLFSLDMYLFPTVLSSIIGAGGGFVLWCYYTRTRCMEEQIPSSVLIG